MKLTHALSLISIAVSFLVTSCATYPASAPADVYQVSPADRTMISTVVLRVVNIRTWKEYSHASPDEGQYEEWRTFYSADNSKPPRGTTQYAFDKFKNYNQERPIYSSYIAEDDTLLGRINFTYAGWESMPHGSEANATHIWDVWLHLENEGAGTAVVDLTNKEAVSGVNIQMEICDGALLDVAGFDMGADGTHSYGLIKSIELFDFVAVLEPGQKTWVRVLFEVPISCTTARLLLGRALPIQLELRPLTEPVAPYPESHGTNSDISGVPGGSSTPSSVNTRTNSEVDLAEKHRRELEERMKRVTP